MKKLLKSIVPLLLGLVFAVGAYGYYHEFIAWDNMIAMYLYAVLSLLSFAGICAFKGKSKKGVIGKFIGGLTGGAVILFGLAMLINNVIFGGTENELSISIVLSVFAVITTVILICYYIKSRKALKKAVCIIMSIITALSGVAGLGVIWGDEIMANIDAATPNVQGVGELPEYEGVEKADFYVSPDGDDKNDGSLEKPFKTIEKARDAVRVLDKTGKTEVVVGIMAGEYRTAGIKFTAEDSGTKDCPIRYCKYGEGEVVINGGVSLNAEDFTAVTDEAMLSRLNDDAKKNVLCVNLSEKYGLTKEDYGRIHAIGCNQTSSKYDGDFNFRDYSNETFTKERIQTGDFTGPIFSEIFVNGNRMHLAQYPDVAEDYLYTGELVKQGDGLENSGHSADETWYERRNHESDVFKMDEALAEKLKSWKTLDDVWMYGWLAVEFADESSLIGEVDYENMTISPKFVVYYGAKADRPYYFFNIFEELTEPGEFYLDRENAVLYIYPTEDMANASIDMTLATDSLFTFDNADYISLEGLTLQNSRADAITLTGNGNEIKYCDIEYIGKNAIVARGNNNFINYTEIAHIGVSAILMWDNSDAATLTPGNNRVENNLVHDCGEVSSDGLGMRIVGLGSVCAHNELYNIAYDGIAIEGQKNIVEYNLIHDVMQNASDGAGIYTNGGWTNRDNVIRYNYIYNLGSTMKKGGKTIEHRGDGLYVDDNTPDTVFYGNIVVNAPKNGILIGSGRENNVRNNIFVNSETAIRYDNRSREGILNDGWFSDSREGGMRWRLLEASPWQTELWQKEFPEMQEYSTDFNDIDKPEFIPNPSNSIVSENIIVSQSKKSIGDIADDVYRFSGDGIKNNLVLSKLEMNKVFTDAANGDYSIKDIEALQDEVPGFEQIPIAEIGIKLP